MKRFADEDAESDEAKRTYTSSASGGGGAASAQETDSATRQWNLDDCLSGADGTSLALLRATATALGTPPTVVTTREALCHEIAAREPWLSEHAAKLEDLGLRKPATPADDLQDYVQSGDYNRLVQKYGSMDNDRWVAGLVGLDRELLNTALRKAIVGSHATLISSLVQAGADQLVGFEATVTLMTKDELNTLLSKMLSSSDKRGIEAAHVEIVLKHGANPNIAIDGEPALTLDSVLRDESIAKLLIQYGADVNVVNKANESPLYKAVEQQNYKLADQQDMSMVTTLLSNGADVHVGKSPLLKAVMIGFWPAVLALLQQGADLEGNERKEAVRQFNSIHEQYDDSILSNVLYDAPPEIKIKKVLIRKMVLWGEDINWHDDNGHTAVYLAVKKFRETFRSKGTVYDKQLHPDEKDPNKMLEMIQLFLDLGASVNRVYATDTDEFQSWYEPPWNTILTEVFRILSGVSPENLGTQARQTVVNIINAEDDEKIEAYLDNTSYVDLLLQWAGTNPYLVGLVMAYKNPSQKVIIERINELLLKYDVSVKPSLDVLTLHDIDYNSGLKQLLHSHKATRFAWLWYLKHGADPTIRNVAGDTVLMDAVRSGNEIPNDDWNYMVQHIGVNATNSAGKTVLDIALDTQNHVAIARLFDFSAAGVEPSLTIDNVPKSFYDYYRNIWIDFAFVRTLGSGANGRVVEIRHRSTGRHYALKMITNTNLFGKSEQEVAQRLDGELMGITQLSASPACSARVACLYGYFSMTPSFSPAILMEMVFGEPLSKVLVPTVNANLVVVWIRNILQALIEIHAKGVAHRDLHADNIIVTQSPQDVAILQDSSVALKAPIVLIDLGSACLKSVALNENLAYSCASDRGNRDYWAPWFASTKPFDFQKWALNDVYSAGVSLYKQLYNHPIADIQRAAARSDFKDSIRIDSPYIVEFFYQTLSPHVQHKTATELLHHLNAYAATCQPFDVEHQVHLYETPRSVQKSESVAQEHFLSSLNMPLQEKLRSVITDFTFDSSVYRRYLLHKQSGEDMVIASRRASTISTVHVQILEAFSFFNPAAANALTLYRGIYNEKARFLIDENVMAAYRPETIESIARFDVGQVVRFGSLLSTSHEPHLAISFMKIEAPLSSTGCYACCLLRFVLPATYPRVNLTLRSTYAIEREVVLPAHVLTARALQLRKEGRLTMQDVIDNFSKYTTLAAFTVKSVKNSDVVYRSRSDPLTNLSSFEERLETMGLYDKSKLEPLRRIKVKLITLVPANGV